MITKEEYLKAKSNLLESIEILRLYKLQPKEKKEHTKKVFTIDQILNKSKNIFNKFPQLKYNQLSKEVSNEFDVGVNKSKYIITEMIKNKIILSKGPRKGYVINQ